MFPLLSLCIFTDMEHFFINFKSDFGTNFNDVALFEIPDSDWQHIINFLNEAQKLRNTKFVQAKMGGSISMTFLDGFIHTSGDNTTIFYRNIKSSVEDIDDEAVGNMLLKVRPFILQKEDINFFRINKLLKRYIDNFFLRRELEILKNKFELRRIQFVEAFKDLGQPPLTFQEIMDWLHTFQYHRDIRKIQVIKNKFGLFKDDRDGLPVFLFSFVEILQAILDLESFIKTLIEFNNSEKAVTVPTEWFHMFFFATRPNRPHRKVCS